MLQVAAGVAFEFILKDVSKTPEEEQSRPHARTAQADTRSILHALWAVLRRGGPVRGAGGGTEEGGQGRTTRAFCSLPGSGQ